ncbi:hypothetical protein KSS87_006309, partial [Heliosperma pusillum]
FFQSRVIETIKSRFRVVLKLFLANGSTSSLFIFFYQNLVKSLTEKAIYPFSLFLRNQTFCQIWNVKMG